MKYKNKKIKPLECYAVVNRQKPKLDVLDIFADKDVHCLKDKEMIIEVVITPK